MSTSINRLMNWSSTPSPTPVDELRLLAQPIAPTPEPAIAPDAAWTTPLAPDAFTPSVPAPVAPEPIAPAMPTDTLTLGQDAWTLDGLGNQLAGLTPAPQPAPAPQPQPAPKPQPKPAAAKPKPKPAPKPAPKPKDDGAEYAAKLRAHLHGAYYKASIQCFRYSWNLVARSGGRSIGQATQSRDGRGHTTAYLGQMVREGRIKVGDIVYVNLKPGADPTSTILSYHPHWFTYIGKGMFADQFGERNADGMARMFPGRKIDTIYRTN